MPLVNYINKVKAINFLIKTYLIDTDKKKVLLINWLGVFPKWNQFYSSGRFSVWRTTCRDAPNCRKNRWQIIEIERFVLIHRLSPIGSVRVIHNSAAKLISTLIFGLFDIAQ
jgi:hypothetical protein